MSALPAFVTHYHRADRPPFANLSALSSDEVDAVLTGLGSRSRRRFGPHYVGLRRATEARLRELFVQVGGRPERPHPHYFVLGESLWFAGLYDEAQSIRLPVSQLPPLATSFTWTDSITALGLGRPLGVPPPRKEWQQGVHRLDELDPVRVARAVDPDDTVYDGYAGRPLQRYVEVQLWSDGPLAEFLPRASS